VNRGKRRAPSGYCSPGSNRQQTFPLFLHSKSVPLLSSVVATQGSPVGIGWPTGLALSTNLVIDVAGAVLTATNIAVMTSSTVTSMMKRLIAAPSPFLRASPPERLAPILAKATRTVLLPRSHRGNGAYSSGLGPLEIRTPAFKRIKRSLTKTLLVVNQEYSQGVRIQKR
jgi:hypothetical protein